MRSQAALYADPAVIVALLIFIAGFGTIYFAGTMGVEECKVIAVKDEKQPPVRRERTKQPPGPRKCSSRRGTRRRHRHPGVPSAPKERAKGTEGYGRRVLERAT